MAGVHSLVAYCDCVPEENQWKLDKRIDFEHDRVQTHLGAIADAMDEWEGRVAEALGLDTVNISSIKTKIKDNLNLQTREALHLWRERNGLDATYRKLIGAFLEAGKTSYAEAVCKVLGANFERDGVCGIYPNKSSTSSTGADLSSDKLSTESLSPSTSTSRSAEDIRPLQFQCRCGSNCTLDVYLDGKCCGSLTNSFPHLNVKHLTDSNKHRLAKKLISDAKTISDMFVDLVCDTFKSLEQTSLEELIAVVRTVGQQSLLNAIDEERSGELSAVKSVFSVQSFLVQYRYISFFNYRILEKIVERFAKPNSPLKSKLRDYLAVFREFCKRSVFEVPDVVIANLAPACDPNNRLVLKIREKDWFGAVNKPSQSNFTLDDVMTLEVELAAIVGVDPANFLVQDIKNGCVEISFVISNGIQSLFPLTALQMKQLSKFGITIIVQPESYMPAAISSIANPLLESANESQGQRLSVSGSLRKSMEESPEMKTDTRPPVKPVVKERMLMPLSDRQQSTLVRLNGYVPLELLNRAKLALRVYGIPYGDLEAADSVYGLYRAIQRGSRTFVDHDAISLLQFMLMLVGVNKDKVNKLGSDEESLEACRKKSKFAELVYRLCAGLSDDDYTHLKGLACGYIDVAPQVIKSREDLFQKCISKEVLQKDDNEFKQFKEWLGTLGRNDLVAEIDTYISGRSRSQEGSPSSRPPPASPVTEPGTSEEERGSPDRLDFTKPKEESQPRSQVDPERQDLVGGVPSNNPPFDVPTLTTDRGVRETLDKDVTPSQERSQVDTRKHLLVVGDGSRQDQASFLSKCTLL